jgi:magnesium chelatase subunit I
VGIIPSITGKIELVYEGEQEGPYQVAYNLLEKTFRTVFGQYFPIPDTKKKRQQSKESNSDNPFRSIIAWFDKGNHLNMLLQATDEEKMRLLYSIDGLYSLVKKYYPQGTDMEHALLMEFVLHGLSSHSLISKKVLEARIEFKDLMGSMLNLGQSADESEEDDLDDDYR